MSVQALSVPHYRYKTDQYSFDVFYSEQESQIQLRMLNGLCNTSSLPATLSILQSELPSIFTSECFNDLHLPFAEEVRKTEIAHLFEHIFLEYFCKLKSLAGERVVINGVTTWNWHQSPRGHFVITIDKGKNDKECFIKALDLTIKTFDRILLSDHSN